MTTPVGPGGIPPSHPLPPNVSKALKNSVGKVLEVTKQGVMPASTQTHFDYERNGQMGFSSKRNIQLQKEGKHLEQFIPRNG